MKLGCKQPGCYQGIGAADSPRPSPNLSSVIKEDDMDWKTSLFPDVVILKGFWASGKLQISGHSIMEKAEEKTLE